MSNKSQDDIARDILLETERQPARERDAYQQRSLQIMLRHAFEQTDFYRHRLAPIMIPNDGIDLSDWVDIPLLARADIQANPEPLFAAQTPKQAGKSDESFTSGSTGDPLRIRFSGITSQVSHAIHHRTYIWNDIDFDQDLASIRTMAAGKALPPDGAIAKSWNPWGSGRRYDLNLRGTTVADQVTWLADRKVKYLRGFPSMCREVLEEGGRQGVDFGLTHLLTTGERVPAELVGDKPSHWPIVVDVYATSETGAIASQCQYGNYHVHTENVLLEILNADGHPVQPGEIGRVVVTSLYNFAMPFIRYAIGDYAEQGGGDCPCGRTLPLIKRIVGRQRDFFRFPGERTVWPMLSARRLQAFVPHRSRQIAQVEPLAVEFRYLPMASDQTEDRQGLAAYIADNLQPGLQVKLVRLSNAGRPHGEKRLDYVCELN